MPLGDKIVPDFELGRRFGRLLFGRERILGVWRQLLFPVALTRHFCY
jgi:hypothetical protein